MDLAPRGRSGWQQSFLVVHTIIMPPSFDNTTRFPSSIPSYDGEGESVVVLRYSLCVCLDLTAHGRFSSGSGSPAPTIFLRFHHRFDRHVRTTTSQRTRTPRFSPTQWLKNNAAKLSSDCTASSASSGSCGSADDSSYSCVATHRAIPRATPFHFAAD